MDFIDRLKQFSKRVEGLKDNIQSEEATKTSLIMPFISLLTSILIGWVIGPAWIIGEVERNGEHFKRAGLYRFMIRYVVPVVMLILFLVSTGFADLIS